MSNGPQFFQTLMGRKFYDADMPRLLKTLERIASALEKQHGAEMEEACAVAAFTMRELIADELGQMYGDAAAERVRAVPLPDERASERDGA